MTACFDRGTRRDDRRPVAVDEPAFGGQFAADLAEHLRLQRVEAADAAAHRSRGVMFGDAVRREHVRIHVRHRRVDGVLRAIETFDRSGSPAGDASGSRPEIRRARSASGGARRAGRWERTATLCRPTASRTGRCPTARPRRVRHRVARSPAASWPGSRARRHRPTARPPRSTRRTSWPRTRGSRPGQRRLGCRGDGDSPARPNPSRVRPNSVPDQACVDAPD